MRYMKELTEKFLKDTYVMLLFYCTCQNINFPLKYSFLLLNVTALYYEFCLVLPKDSFKGMSKKETQKKKNCWCAEIQIKLSFPKMSLLYILVLNDIFHFPFFFSLIVLQIQEDSQTVLSSPKFFTDEEDDA